MTITGTNFGTTQATSTVKFNGTTSAVTSWSATSIAATVPTGATTGNVVVTVSGSSSNGKSFTIVAAPSLTSLSPTSGAVGVSVTVTGANFGSTQGSSTVKFNGTAGTPTSWSATSIKVPVPSGATTGNILVFAGGVNSNGVSFTVLATPSIGSLSPTSGAVGASVTITGTNFGSSQGGSTVKFNGTTATATSWSATSIAANVPSGATTGNVVVTVSGVASNGMSFTVVSAPSITSLSPTSGAVGASVTVTGTNFGSTQGSSTVKFNGTAGTPTSWSATGVKVPVPAGATTGNVVVHASGVDSNGKSFTFLATPTVTNLSPTSGGIGTSVTIAGTNFGSTQGSSTVKFNGTTATTITSWSATSIAANAPSGASTGNVVVTVSGLASNGASFTVLPTPSITSLSPTSGPVNTSLTIAGTNFGATQGTSTVALNGATATAISWSPTSITTAVPAAATSGNVIVTVNGVASPGSAFTVLPIPSITNLSPTSGTVNTSVTIAGTSFGTIQGTSTVTFAGTSATPTNWSAASIVAPVPSGATTGDVVVTVGGVASNGSGFTVPGTSSISSLSPSTGGVGSWVLISGTAFGSSQGSNTVQFNGVVAQVTSWGPSQVAALVPSLSVGSVQVTITVGGISTNALPFSVVPSMTTVTPGSGPIGAQVTVTGSNLGSSGTVTFNGTTASVVTSWTDTAIVAQVPSGATSGPVVISAGGLSTQEGIPFTVLPTLGPPTGISVTPNTLSMLAGSDRSLTVIDSNGQVATGVSWTTSDSSIASFDPNTGLLTTNDPGTATLTATYQTFTAQATVTVYSGTSFPAGTVLWSGQSTADGYSTSNLIQTTPTGTNAADLLAVDTQAIGPGLFDISVQGLTLDGQQPFASALGNSDPSSLTPDGLGGLVFAPVVSSGGINSY